MCLYQTDLEWRRRAAVDERPRDVASTELDGLVVARSPAPPARRPVLQRVMGVMCAVGGRVRRLAGRVGIGAPAAGVRLRPGAQ